MGASRQCIINRFGALAWLRLNLKQLDGLRPDGRLSMATVVNVGRARQVAAPASSGINWSQVRPFVSLFARSFVRSLARHSSGIDLDAWQRAADDGPNCGRATEQSRRHTLERRLISPVDWQAREWLHANGRHSIMVCAAEEGGKLPPNASSIALR